MMGAVAPAASLRPYSSAPWLDQAGHRLQMAGWVDDHDRTVVRSTPDPARSTSFLFKSGELVGAESVNSPADHVAVRRLLAARVWLSPDQVADPQWELRRHCAAIGGTLAQKVRP